MKEINIMKINGLHSGTKFYERNVGNSRLQYHEHPETGELVVVLTWAVMDGECISYESEVLEVQNPFACAWSKKLVGLGVKPQFNLI